MMAESGRVRFAKGFATLVHNSANPNLETNPIEVYGRQTLMLKSGLFLGLIGKLLFKKGQEDSKLGTAIRGHLLIQFFSIITVQQGKDLFKGDTKNTFSKSFT